MTMSLTKSNKEIKKCFGKVESRYKNEDDCVIECGFNEMDRCIKEAKKFKGE